MKTYALILLVSGLFSGPVQVEVGSDEGIVREDRGRIERVQPCERTFVISIGSDEGTIREDRGRIERVQTSRPKP